MEDNVMEIDMEEIKSSPVLEEVQKAVVETPVQTPKVERYSSKNEQPLISCLRNERVIVRHINRPTGLVDNPKHILYGNIAPNAVKKFTLPKLTRSNTFVNPLTDSEKRFLESYMGLEYNQLSIYNKTENNFWVNRWVRLGKDDTILDLSNPQQYIDYKILLANKDFIAPSLEAYENYPKRTYQYMIVSDSDLEKKEESNMSTTMRCYKAFGKIEEDIMTMRVVVELMEGKPTASTVKSPFLKGRINTLIQSNPKLFLRIVDDPYLPTKVLMKSALEQNIITKRGEFYYYDGNPLCEDGQEPNYSTAAAYLNSPRHQTLKFAIEARLK